MSDFSTPTGLNRNPDPQPLRADPPAESWRTRLWRHAYNLFPAYRGTGARVDHIGGDWRYVRVRVPYNWRTRNLMGAIFGGSLYGAVDPIYMTLLDRHLGDDFTVWDKAAAVEFLKPGRDTLYAEFTVDDELLDGLRETLDPGESADRAFRVHLVDEEGVVHAVCEKTLYVRRDE
ncbi:hotdog fold domain-containing protein [Halorubrum gandharaense]